MSEIDSLHKYLKTFVNIKDVQELEEKVVPKLNRTEKLLVKFHSDNEKMMVCVQEFDKKLCLKANKQKVE